MINFYCMFLVVNIIIFYSALIKKLYMQTSHVHTVPVPLCTKRDLLTYCLAYVSCYFQ